MAEENPENRKPAAGAERRPDGTFRPGNAANPGGQPKWLKAVRAQLRDLTPLAASRLKQVITEGDDKDATAASRVVLEYTVPKPKQTMKVEGGSKDPLGDLTAEALVAFIKNGGGK